MQDSSKLRETIIEIVDNQITKNTPPETKIHFERLQQIGYSELDSKKLIGQCLAVELFGIFKHGAGFDEDRYLLNMKNLPKDPTN